MHLSLQQMSMYLMNDFRSDRIKKEFGKICKQVKQSFGFCKNPQAADLNHQLVIKDGC